MCQAGKIEEGFRERAPATEEEARLQHDAWEARLVAEEMQKPGLRTTEGVCNPNHKWKNGITWKNPEHIIRPSDSRRG